MIALSENHLPGQQEDDFFLAGLKSRYKNPEEGIEKLTNVLEL